MNINVSNKLGYSLDNKRATTNGGTLWRAVFINAQKFCYEK